METKKLRRSRNDAVLAGVCGGIANYLGIDSTSVRIICFLLIVFVGLSIWVYIIAAIFIPLEEVDEGNNEYKNM